MPATGAQKQMITAAALSTLVAALLKQHADETFVLMADEERMAQQFFQYWIHHIATEEEQVEADLWLEEHGSSIVSWMLSDMGLRAKQMARLHFTNRWHEMVLDTGNEDSRYALQVVDHWIGNRHFPAGRVVLTSSPSPLWKTMLPEDQDAAEQLYMRQVRRQDLEASLHAVERLERAGPGRSVVVWKTGVPVLFDYARNTEPAPDLGEQFAQHLEPAGRYLTVLGVHPEDLPPGWEHGTLRFENPLVIALTWPPDGRYAGPEGWKARLSHAFDGKTGLDLSRAVRNAGYDGIVTVSMSAPGNRPGYVSEIVDLTPIEQ